MTVSRSVQKLQTHASYELFTNGEVFFHWRYVIKSVFSYLRTLTTWHCPHSPAARRCFSNRSISPARRAHSSKPAAARVCFYWSNNINRQTDRHEAIASTLSVARVPSYRPGEGETIRPPAVAVVSRRIYVRPRTGPQSAHG